MCAVSREKDWRNKNKIRATKSGKIPYRNIRHPDRLEPNQATKSPEAFASGLFDFATQRLMMLTRRTEFHVRPALFHQRQVDPGRREVGQMTAAVQCQVFHSLVGE